MVSRRKLLKILGGSAMALSSIGLLTHLGLLGAEQSRVAASPPGGYWFEKIAAEPSGDDVVLEFVDEDDNPVDFSAFLIWEPTGDVEEVATKNGRLKLPKKRLVEQADQWRDKLKRADQPTLTENPLFVISPISLKAEFLPYTVVIETPRFVNIKI